MSQRMIVSCLVLTSATLVNACSSTGPRDNPDGSDGTGQTSTDAPEPEGQTPDTNDAPGATNGMAMPPGSSLEETPPTGIGLTPAGTETPGGTAPPGAMQPEGEGGLPGPAPSAGCGSTAPVDGGRFTIDVDGATREYILALPDDYDANRPYRLIFGWHPRGGSADSVANGFGGGYYGLEQRANGSAIFVSAEGIDEGWANTGGRDIALLRAMLDRFESELCIDENRIFSTGFSYGGMMSFAIGCAMGDVFRAIAPMSGALYSGCEDGDNSVAVWASHGDADDVVPIDNGERARDVFLERNHCQAASTAVEPGSCVSYDGCDAGYPVVWCEFSGDHALPTGFGESIWQFFSQF